ncbi:D-alanyl-D-alanine carboxypeptidase family protein [Acetivibrio thermocellus]|uniref:D-alanyl-D-alanine carboxypeptidase family protein n=1 Tax=Acetivibrio thermocellus TaxID=1515 RepID=UPI0010A612E3|nr:D-alanyl-D-alanine carboxypeptidase family protein [Acetivibrio thermocellus]THJ78869.1 D-alanyl-D-alanine carboxypeptidase [Acetivibrio thermocellus]
MKRLLLLLIMTIILFSNIVTLKAQPLDINARAYILIDSKTGQVLAEHNPDLRTYPASTTKIMTAILALELGDLNQIMTVSQSAIDDIGPGGMHIGLLPDEQLELRYLLDALLVRSANETAYVIAENLCSSREEFYRLMNEKARELGATNTNFVNPCGIDNGEKGKNHLTTARDLAKIAQYAMTIPEFREIVQKTIIKIPPTNKHAEEVIVGTTNKLLLYSNSKYKSEHYTKITGIKTGYTDRALNNLVSSAVNDEGTELIAVVLGVENYDMVFEYSKMLLEYGFKNYSVQPVIAPNSYITSVPVLKAAGNHNLDILASPEGLKCLLPNNSTKNDYEIEQHILENIEAPVKKGDVLGYIEVKKDGVTIGKIDAVASRDVEKLEPPVEPQNIIIKTANDPILKKVTTGALIFLLMFLMLRFTLRRISRSLHSKR